MVRVLAIAKWLSIATVTIFLSTIGMFVLYVNTVEKNLESVRSHPGEGNYIKLIRVGSWACNPVYSITLREDDSFQYIGALWVQETGSEIAPSKPGTYDNLINYLHVNGFDHLPSCIQENTTDQPMFELLLNQKIWIEQF